MAQTWPYPKRIWLDPGLTLEPQETSDETRLVAASAGQPFLLFPSLVLVWNCEGRTGTRHG